MKRLQLILSIGFLTLGLSLSVGLAYIRYGLDKVSGTFFDDVGKYMPVIVLIVLSFLIQLGIIFYKDE